jgi:hypothetical protein
MDLFIICTMLNWMLYCSFIILLDCVLVNQSITEKILEYTLNLFIYHYYRKNKSKQEWLYFIHSELSNLHVSFILTIYLFNSYHIGWIELHCIYSISHQYSMCIIMWQVLSYLSIELSHYASSTTLSKLMKRMK